MAQQRVRWHPHSEWPFVWRLCQSINSVACFLSCSTFKWHSESSFLPHFKDDPLSLFCRMQLPWRGLDICLRYSWNHQEEGDRCGQCRIKTLLDPSFWGPSRSSYWYKNCNVQKIFYSQQKVKLWYNSYKFTFLTFEAANRTRRCKRKWQMSYGPNNCIS
jgi:hypothetical protein